MSVQKLDHLVVDTSGFLKNVPLWNYAENLVTIREVFDEIKDPELKNYVLAFPVPVAFREPNQKSIDFVVEFSKKTGDYIALSVPDIKVMALAHQMEVARNGDQHLRTEPTRRQCNANTTYHSNVTDHNATHSNVTQSNVTDDSKAADSNVTDSNLTDSKLTDSNATQSNVTDSNVKDSNVTDSNVTDSNKIGDSIDLISTDSIKLSVESDAKENLPLEDVAEENEGSEEEEDDGEGWCMQKGKRGKKMNRKPKRQQFNKSDARSVTTSGSRRRNLDLRYNLPGWYISHDKPAPRPLPPPLASARPLLQFLQRHFTSFSYASGHAPFWPVELLLMKLLGKVLDKFNGSKENEKISKGKDNEKISSGKGEENLIINQVDRNEKDLFSRCQDIAAVVARHEEHLQDLLQGNNSEIFDEKCRAHVSDFHAENSNEFGVNIKDVEACNTNTAEAREHRIRATEQVHVTEVECNSDVLRAFYAFDKVEFGDWSPKGQDLTAIWRWCSHVSVRYMSDPEEEVVRNVAQFYSKDFAERCDGMSDETRSLLDAIRVAVEPETVAEEGEENSDEEEEEEDDDECWVTPENLHAFPTTDEVEHLEEDEDQQIEDHPDIACMTGDFAMQNVLRQIGLPVIGVDGKLIRRTRCYVLRCHTCFHVTHIMDKLFCPRCGNMTMKRVAMTTNEDGSQQLWISSKPLSARGLKFQLPKPRGGPHAVKPLLTADQRFPHQRAKMNRKLDLQNAQCIDDAPFAYKDVSSRAFAQGNVGTLGYKGHFAHAKIWRPKKRRMVQK